MDSRFVHTSQELDTTSLREVLFSASHSLISIILLISYPSLSIICFSLYLIRTCQLYVFFIWNSHSEFCCLLGSCLSTFGTPILLPQSISNELSISNETLHLQRISPTMQWMWSLLNHIVQILPDLPHNFLLQRSRNHLLRLRPNRRI